MLPSHAVTARRAAGEVYEAAGVAPADLDVIELHDCFAQNELLTYGKRFASPS